MINSKNWSLGLDHDQFILCDVSELEALGAHHDGSIFIGAYPDFCSTGRTRFERRKQFQRAFDLGTAFVGDKGHGTCLASAVAWKNLQRNACSTQNTLPRRKLLGFADGAKPPIRLREVRQALAADSFENPDRLACRCGRNILRAGRNGQSAKRDNRKRQTFHDQPFTAFTIFSAPSARFSAAITSRPELLMMSLPASTFVPSRRTTSGT